MSTDDAAAASTQKLSYKKAAAILSETEKNRILCIVLTCLEHYKPTGDEFKLAAEQFGATVGGFTKSFQNHMKKLKEGNCYIIEGEDVAAIPDPVDAKSKKAATPKTPKTPKTTSAKKRKGFADEGENGEGGESMKKARTPRQKKETAEPTIKDEQEEAGEEEVGGENGADTQMEEA